MGTPTDSKRTRAKILEAAGQLFAERGFKGVTVRDIAAKAQTHLGALNYHFRSKDALYREVLLEACDKASISGADQDHLLAMEPRRALRLLVEESLKSCREQSGANWQATILARECWEPTDSFSEAVDQYFKPQSDFIAGLVARIVDQPSDAHSVRFAEVVLIGLLESLGLYGHYLRAVAPGLADFGHSKDWFVDQITHLVIEAAKPRDRA